MSGGFSNVPITNQIIYDTVLNHNVSSNIKRLNNNIFGELEIDTYNSLVKAKIYKMDSGENNESAKYTIGSLLPIN